MFSSRPNERVKTSAAIRGKRGWFKRLQQLAASNSGMGLLRATSTEISPDEGERLSERLAANNELSKERAKKTAARFRGSTGLQTHSKRLSHVTGMLLPPGLSSTSLSSRDRAVKFSITMSEKMARVTPAGRVGTLHVCVRIRVHVSSMSVHGCSA